MPESFDFLSVKSPEYQALHIFDYLGSRPWVHFDNLVYMLKGKFKSVFKRFGWLSAAGWLIAFGVLFFYRTTYSFDNLVSTTLALNAIDFVCLFTASTLLNSFLVPKYLFKKRILSF